MARLSPFSFIGLIGICWGSYDAKVSGGETHKVVVRVIDGETSLPIGARIYLHGPDQKPYYFTSLESGGTAIRYEKQNWNNARSVEHHTTVSPHPCLAEVPSGKYELRVERGQVCFPVTRTFEIDRDISLAIPLTPWFDPNRLGWYSGDTHLHRSIDELKNILVAEDLNVAMPLTHWVTQSDQPPSKGDKNIAETLPNELIEVDSTHVIWPRNTEYEIFTIGPKRHTLGALFVLGHRESLERGVPPWKPVIEQAVASGALLDMDKLDWPFSMVLPVLAPTALYELTNNHMWRTEFGFRQWNSPTPGFLQPPFGNTQGGEREWIDYTLGMYYALLNCGLKMPPSAGTANGVHPVPAGFGRVYVHVPGPFSYKAWLEGLGKGRSFVTTGPMLIASADEAFPGETFHLAQGEKKSFRLRIEVDSETPLAYAEVIVNGEPLQLLRANSAPSRIGSYRTQWEVQVEVDRSGWFAVRTWENREKGRIRFAHTAPWYVQMENEPVRIPFHEKEYLVQRMQGEIERSRTVLRDEAIAEYREALAFYESRPVKDDAELVRAESRPLQDDGKEVWLKNMIVHHRFTASELRLATGLSIEEAQREIERLTKLQPNDLARSSESNNQDRLLVLPYPGGRHPRRGFLDGAIRPQRDTKLSLFAPWKDGGYVVIDAPEAIFSNLGLLYLAHTHVPTLWSEKGIDLPKREWEPNGSGWSMSQTLPNGVRFGCRVEPQVDRVSMDMELTNGTDQKLTGLRTQVCSMLKAADGFQSQSAHRIVERGPFIAIRAAETDRWLITAWTPNQRVWSNPPVPCIHSDPQFPDCPPGETVHVRGNFWFYEGDKIESKLKELVTQISDKGR